MPSAIVVKKPNSQTIVSQKYSTQDINISVIKTESGLDGESAYQTALDNGFVGTERQWIDSLVGASGQDGKNGTNGVNGINGLNGQDGYTPIKGIDYFDGIQGIQGIQGIKGDKGDQGERGLQGEIGSIGLKGDTGEQGIQGIQGERGLQGADGYTPIKDADYFNGTNGVNGINGLNGHTPIKGVDYFDGEDGLTTSVNGIAQVNGEITLTKSNLGLSNVVNLDTSTTSNITDSLNKRFISDVEKTNITHNNKTALDNVSGTNTGDETTSTIKTKLGITVLSGENTGDEDLSGLVTKTTTVNGHELSSNVTVTKSDVGLSNVVNLDTSTTSNITDTTTKRFVADTEKTTWNAKEPAITKNTGFNLNLSTTATDIKMNGTQSLGVATTLPRADHVHPSDTTKQDTLVSGTNIRTVNGNTLLGTTDIVVQQTLVSGTNIKTINGSTILGSGDLVISGGEVNTTSNSGVGNGLALQKVGVDLPFKSLVAGSNITIDSGADTLTINSSGGSSNTPTYTSVSVPTAPTTDSITLFARNRAGRMMLNTISPIGFDTPLQNALFGNNVYMWLPSNSTTVSIGFGTLWTARNTTGAQATPAKSITNILTNMSRATFSSTAVVNTGAGIQSSATTVCRSNTNAYGGFFFFARFGMETINGSGQQLFIGLNTLNGVLTGEPSLQNNSIGIGKDSTDLNWQIISRNTSAVTKLDTGVTIVTGQIYDLIMFCKPNDTKVTIRLVRLSDNAVLLDNVDITATLPVNTTYMYACAHLRNTGTAINALALNRIYVETDI